MYPKKYSLFLPHHPDLLPRQAATMEDQVRWAVSIEKISHASQLTATVVPLPSADRPSARRASIEIATRGRGSSLAAPSVSMLKQNFSAVKVSAAPKPSTSLAKYRQWTSSQGSNESRGERRGSPLSSLGQDVESKLEPKRISDKIVVKTTSVGTRETRALRKTLRNLDRIRPAVTLPIEHRSSCSTRRTPRCRFAWHGSKNRIRVSKRPGPRRLRYRPRVSQSSTRSCALSALAETR